MYKHSWLLITWTLKKLNSIQTILDSIAEVFHRSLLSKIYKNSYLITPILFVLNNLSNNPLVHLQILSYWESTVHHRYFQNLTLLLLVYWCDDRTSTDSILKSTHSRDFQLKKNHWKFCTVEQKAIIYLIPWRNFEIKLKEV